VTRLFGGVVIAALLLLLSAGLALAHAELEESDPADGATITTPYTLTATFSEEFDPNPRRSFIRIVDSSGTRVAEGGVSSDDATMMVVELPELAPGLYEARWQTVTQDDNGVELGTFQFTVAEVSASPSPGSATPRPTSSPPSASAPAPTAAPTNTRPTPAPTPSGGNGQPAASGADILLALVLAAIVLAGLGAYLYMRSRR
jgi:methionine-rich copper-binding protein CopC